MPCAQCVYGMVAVGTGNGTDRYLLVHPNPLVSPCPIVSILSRVVSMVVTGNAIATHCTAPAATLPYRLRPVTGTLNGRYWYRYWYRTVPVALHSSARRLTPTLP